MGRALAYESTHRCHDASDGRNLTPSVVENGRQRIIVPEEFVRAIDEVNVLNGWAARAHRFRLGRAMP
jgi:hypothetical protein